MEIKLKSNSEAVVEALDTAVLRALEEIGLYVEGVAAGLAPVDTGNLRNSITHEVAPNERAVYIGTNTEYAAFVELGTGKYTQGGRQTPWVYKDEEGHWHYTEGQRAQPFLKPAAAGSVSAVNCIIADNLKNASAPASGGGRKYNFAGDLKKAVKSGIKTGKKIERNLKKTWKDL